MTKEAAIRQILDAVVSGDQSKAIESINEAAKRQSILFNAFIGRFRMEESAAYRKTVEKVGVITVASPTEETIYDLFASGHSIESASMPGVIYKYDEGKEIAWHGDKKL